MLDERNLVMGNLAGLALASVLAVGATAAAAADLLPAPAPVEPAYAAPVEVGGGWYLRGDVGVSHVETSRWQQARRFDDTSTVLRAGFITDQIEGSAFAGIGIGYQFNSWFRADLTAEYRHAATARGTYQEHTSFGCFIGTCDFRGQNNYRGSLDSIVVLANGYFDLGTWHGITPFVGAGVGFAHNRMTGFTEDGYQQGTLSGFGPVATSLIVDNEKTNFAWALHAGLGYAVSPNLKLELGYRYLNLGEARTGSIQCGTFTGTGSACAPGVKVEEIQSHDIKLGMRWMLGGPAYAAPAPVLASYPALPEPMPMPARPIVRKY